MTDVAELRAKREKRDELRAEMRDIEARLTDSDGDTAGLEQRAENLRTGLRRLDAELVEADRAYIDTLAKDPRHREGPAEDRNTRRRSTMSTTTRGSDVHDAARRSIDKAYERGDLGEKAGFRLNDVVEADKFGVDSAYIAAVASPEYLRAFGKKLTGSGGAEAVLEPEEAEAMLAVGRAMSMRAMAAGEGSAGGFGVPLSLDPTILLTNDGAVNPIRDLATVSTIATTKWAGVSSAGVEAKFAGEATSPEDGSPELGQPTITPEKAQIWVPYTIEVGMDWSGLAAELAKLFADARAIKEAEVFATGKGSEHIPQGLITGATEVVETGTKEVVKVADVYATQEKLAARWQPRANWLGTNTVANTVHRLVAAADATNAPLMNEARTEILGKPFREVSTMSAKVTTKNERVLAYGDIKSAYRIVDRIGLTVEPVPLVMKEGVPTGERGLYAWFRVGAKVVIPEAVQVLAIKNE